MAIFGAGHTNPGTGEQPAQGPGPLLMPDPALRPHDTWSATEQTVPPDIAGTEADGPHAAWSGDDPLPKVLAAPNPLLEAARSLLRALTELPVLPSLSAQATATAGGSKDSLERLHQTLVRDMRRFLSLCGRAGFRREHVVTAGYCLCTALDEAVSKAGGDRGGLWTLQGNMPGAFGNEQGAGQGNEQGNEQGTGWASRSLLLLFHNETHGGEKFFLLLGHMVQTPRAHLHVLELLYRILCLGFEGRYALSMDGARRLETIQRKLLTVLMEHTEPVPRELSPHWSGLSGGRLHFMRTVPVWVTASVLGMVLTALFMTSTADLAPLAASTVRQIRQLATQPDMPDLPRWKEELPLELWFTDADMQRYGLSVDIPQQILHLPGSLTFTNGIQLNPLVRPILNIIALRLKETQRPVLLLGHTDNTPLRTGSVFKDNQHLSEERARIVAQELQDRGIAPERLTTAGKSDTQPLGDNETVSGRTRNRRVELVLHPMPPETTPQTETGPAPEPIPPATVGQDASPASPSRSRTQP